MSRPQLAELALTKESLLLHIAERGHGMERSRGTLSILFAERFSKARRDSPALLRALWKKAIHFLSEDC